MNKVKVKMFTTFADEEQTASPGQIISVSIHQARELIAGKYAEPVGISAQAIMDGRVGTAAASRQTATREPAETRKDPAAGEGDQQGDKPGAKAGGKGGGKKAGAKVQPPQP